MFIYFLNEKTKNLKPQFNELDWDVKDLVSVFLTKINKIDSMDKILKLGEIKKRNEEMIKMIYKPTIKHFISLFKSKLNKSKKKLNLFDCNLKNFHYDCFKELIKAKEIHVDLIMDICGELTIQNKKKTLKINKSNNWQHSKFRNMKKISTLYRYLIKQSPRLLKKFTNYFKNKLKTSFIESIDNKLKKKQDQWSKMVKEASSFSEFAKLLKVKINGDKFKSPWPIHLIIKSINFCLKEISENPDLEQDFNNTQELHYSSI